MFFFLMRRHIKREFFMFKFCVKAPLLVILGYLLTQSIYSIRYLEWALVSRSNVTLLPRRDKVPSVFTIFTSMNPEKKEEKKLIAGAGERLTT